MDIELIKSDVLEILKKDKKGIVRFEDLLSKINVDQSILMRSLLDMQNNRLINIQESDRIEIRVTEEGKKVLEEGLPECILVNKLKEIGKEIHISRIDIPQKNIAIAWAKNKNLIDIVQGIVKLKRECTEEDMKEINYLKEIGNKEYFSLNIDQKILEILKKRKFIEVIPKTVKYIKITQKGKNTTIKYEETIKEVTPEIIIKESWRNKTFKKYNIYAQSYSLYPGKKHYVTQAIEYIRKIWLDMGFEEMRGNMLIESFWNFDALFVPQNHPAREMQDTFYIDMQKSNNIDATLLKKIKIMHEKGDKNSIGWGYEYDEKKAKEWVLRTHTTALSALTLYNIDIKDLPKKYFAIGKVFRNETLDWKHLFEFYQVEGIVVDENLNFRHLIGYIKEFFSKMGHTNIRIRPAYFPYTELSMEIEVLIPGKGWTELGGAGIFRPEVVKPLLGKEIPVLAWGLGLERIIMNYYNFTDIRNTYTDNINLLRESKKWLL